MAKPSADQTAFLNPLRVQVLSTMQSMERFEDAALNELRTVPLGVLRRSATQRHGVTRWERKADGRLTVATVDLHPRLLNEAWADYAAFVLFHEFLHAMGWRAHDRRFRTLESTWPDPKGASRGLEFTHRMREGKATWYWVCPECEQRYPRQRRGGGRYLCRRCRQVLQDVPVQDAD